jgi:hypothetical protein
MIKRTFFFFQTVSLFAWLQMGSLLGVAQTSPSLEQILGQARQEVDTLCSASFAGRGYVEDGHKKAANYLASRFEEIGLRPMGDFGGYEQAFPIQINLAKQASLLVGKDSLQAGSQFIVNRFSGSGEVSAKVKDVGYGLKASPSIRGKVVLFRDGWPAKIANDSKKKDAYQDLARDQQRVEALLVHKPAAVIIVKEKLTMGFAREVAPVPILEVLDSALTKKAKRATLQVSSGMERIRSQNVIGMIPGKEVPDSFLVVTAHYDHLGKLEHAIFPGANDNASGIAMLLSLATHFAQTENQPRYSMLFIAFGGEETGLLGSRYYVEQAPVVALKQMKFLLNVDLMGNGVDGIMAVGGQDFPEAFADLQAINEQLEAGVSRVRSRRNAPNSDHFFFLQQGVPGFFIYTEGGPRHYHDVHDIPAHLELSRFVEVRELLLRFLGSR